MWSGARIVKRSRFSSRGLWPNTSACVSSWWVPSVDDGPNDQHRQLTVGRRHGWKGKDGRGPTPPEDEDRRSFPERFINPAARGELQKGHQSAIPNLAVRGHKGHGVHTSDPELTIAQVMKEEDVEIDDDEVIGDEDNLLASLQRDARGHAGSSPPPQEPQPKTLVISGRDKYDSSPREVRYLPYDNGQGDEYYYWEEEEYDVQDGIMIDDEVFTFDELNEVLFEHQKELESAELPVDEATLRDHLEKQARLYMEQHGIDPSQVEVQIADRDKQDVDGGAVVSAGGNAAVASDAESDKDSRISRTRGWHSEEEDDDDDEVDEDDADYDAIAPIGEHGSDADSWWDAVENAPTRHVMMQSFAPHPDSRREPKPDFPKNRRHPPIDFVEDFHRFLYVSGLPTVEGAKDGKKKPGELNALQEQEMQHMVTRLLGVKSEQVYAANDESAFVAFHSAEEREAIIRKGPLIEVISRPVTMSKYDPSKEGGPVGFLKDAKPDLIVKLENLPPRYNRYNRPCLVRDLFPEDSEMAAAYLISPEDIQFRSPGVAFVRFASEQQAESALASPFVDDQLIELGQYPVRLFKARRELVYKHMGGPARNDEIREMGPRLIVDGDMPGRRLYISHSGTIQLRNVDSTITKEELTAIFQPYSLLQRDVEGSIEIVKCIRGIPSGKVYVGFDRLGEAEHAVRSLWGKMDIGGTLTTMKLMKDRWMPGAVPREQRPERSEEEILRSLNDWEQYVDQKDVKLLEEAGISKVVLDDALRSIRFHNESFSTLDLSMGDEKLEPEKHSGDNYRQLVQTYVETLKECIATPENPGMLYEGLHFPDEAPDLSIFDTEKARLKKLLRRREGL